MPLRCASIKVVRKDSMNSLSMTPRERWNKNPANWDKKPVPPAVLQSKAEEIYVESGGRWGTPPGIPLVTYNDMCKSRGLIDTYSSNRHRREGLLTNAKHPTATAARSKARKATHLGVRDEYSGPDKISGKEAESNGA